MHGMVARGLIASSLIVFCGPDFRASFARADEAEANAAIARLLNVGWPANLQARAAADAQYQEVQKVAPDDPRAFTASWLVLMQQRRYDDALKRIEQHLAVEPASIEAQRAKAWNTAILKDYAAAMLTADKLSVQLEELPPITEADRTRYEETVTFLGRLFGFLGGPAAANVNQDQRKAAEKQVLARIDTTSRPVFEEARDSVLQTYIELTDDKAVEREKAVESAETEKQKTLEDVAAEREQIGARDAELRERREKLQAELKAELDELAKQDRPLMADLARLESRADVLNRDYASYQLEMDRLERLAARERDQNRRQLLFFEVDRLQVIANRIDSDLIGVNRLARGVQEQRAVLFAQGQQAQANAVGQVSRIDEELKGLAKRERRAGGIEKRAARPVSATTGKVRALSAQAMALSTYDPFPLEAARAKLLESLR